MTAADWNLLLDADPGNAELRRAYAGWLQDEMDDVNGAEFQRWLAAEGKWPTRPGEFTTDWDWWNPRTDPKNEIPDHARLSLELFCGDVMFSFPTRAAAEAALFEAWLEQRKASMDANYASIVSGGGRCEVSEYAIGQSCGVCGGQYEHEKGCPQRHMSSVVADELGRAAILADNDALRTVLSSLSSWLGMGLGDATTTPEQWEQRIREGVDLHIRVQTDNLKRQLAETRDGMRLQLSQDWGDGSTHSDWASLPDSQVNDAIAEAKRRKEAEHGQD